MSEENYDEETEYMNAYYASEDKRIARDMYVALKHLSEIDWFYDPATNVQDMGEIVEGYKTVSIMVTGVSCRYCGQQANTIEEIKHVEGCYVAEMEKVIADAETFGYRLTE